MNSGIRVRICLLTLLLGARSLLADEPVASPTEPPSVASLLQRVIAQKANDPDYDRQFDARYAYERVRTFEVREGDGDLIRQEVKRLSNDPARAHTSEDDAVVPTDARGRKGRAYHRRDFQLTEELLQRFQYTLAGQELVAGRPAWILDFQPAKPALPTKDLKDRFINKTAGRVWIDATEAVVVRGHFHLIDSVNVFGGLVGAVRQCNTTFERERTHAGDWYVRRFDWHLEGRKLFSKRIMDFHEERDRVRATTDPSLP